jgi:ADP-heptose:LPS heptosyltransferase
MAPQSLPEAGVLAAAAAAAPPQRIAVFRALMLGDLLCATPALRALRHAWPEARITLIGQPWAWALAARLRSIDDFVAFPGWPGLPESQGPPAPALRRWLGARRAERHDWLLQLHGSGERVNALVTAMGAHEVFGFAPQAAAVGRARFIDWPRSGSEVERLLALTDAMGAPRRGDHLDFPLRDSDRDAAEPLAAPLRGQRFAIVHPGSQLPSRRWPAERFAAVADALAGEGLAIVLTGSPHEAPLTRAVADAMRAPCLDLTGRTSLWELGALVEWATQVVCNDTGISHIAAALDTPSVVVANGSDVARWAPADSQRHRVLWHDLPCRPCTHAHCPYGQACARAVPAQAVAQQALRLVRGATAPQVRELAS